MPAKLNKKHVWANARIAPHEAYIEARESKPTETGSVLVFVFGPIACFVIYALYPARPNSLTPDTLLVCGVIGAVIGFAILCLYRPPRVLRLYPLEQVAHTSRRFFMIRFPGKWHDLSAGAPTTTKMSFITTQEQMSIGKGLVVLLLLLLGPLGLIIGLAAGSGRNETRVPTYGLKCPGLRGQPLALFTKRTDCEKLVRYYAQAKHLGM